MRSNKPTIGDSNCKFKTHHRHCSFKSQPQYMLFLQMPSCRLQAERPGRCAPVIFLQKRRAQDVSTPPIDEGPPSISTISRPQSHQPCTCHDPVSLDALPCQVRANELAALGLLLSGLGANIGTPTKDVCAGRSVCCA